MGSKPAIALQRTANGGGLRRRVGGDVLKEPESYAGMVFDISSSSLSSCDDLVSFSPRAELTAHKISTPSSPKTAETLFRWVHLEREIHTYEAFIELAVQAPGIAQDEITGIVEHARNIRDKRLRDERRTTSGLAGYADACAYANMTHWSFCMPYFSLLRHHGNDVHMEPRPRTLMQALYTQSCSQRDLHQSVRQLESCPPNHSFHVAQMWCLVIEDRLLVTAARLSADTLYANSMLKVSIEPPHSGIGNLSLGYIQLSDFNGKLWLLPSSKCRTWLGLMAHLTSIESDFEETYDILLEDKVVSSRHWSSLPQRRLPGLRLTLRRKKCELQNRRKSPLDMFRASVEPDVTDADDSLLERHILVAHSQRHDFPVTEQSALQCVDDILVFRDQCRMAHALSRRCMRTSAQYDRKVQHFEIRSAKLDLKRSILEAADCEMNLGESKAHDRLKFSLMIARRLATIVRFFLSLPAIASDSPVVLSFFGALRCFLKNCSTRPESQLAILDGMTRQLAGVVGRLSHHLFDAEDPLREHITDTNEFLAAFLRLELFVLNIGAEEEVSVRKCGKHLELMLQALQQGEGALKRQCVNMKVRTWQPGVPLVAISAFVHRLLQDVTVGEASGVVATNVEYLNVLERQCYDHQTTRSQREHTRHMGYRLSTELKAIQIVLSAQASVLAAWAKTIDPKLYANTVAPPTTANAYDMAIRTIRSCIVDVSAKRTCVDELAELNGELRRELNYAIDAHKDRHQQAITVFTIVTVVFLPLSFVASVFGMNTAEIRNMQAKQWAYWSIAVPLTIAVVMLSSAWAGLLRLPWREGVAQGRYGGLRVGHGKHGSNNARHSGAVSGIPALHCVDRVAARSPKMIGR